MDRSILELLDFSNKDLYKIKSFLDIGNYKEAKKEFLEYFCLAQTNSIPNN